MKYYVSCVCEHWKEERNMSIISKEDMNEHFVRIDKMVRTDDGFYIEYPYSPEGNLFDYLMKNGDQSGEKK